MRRSRSEAQAPLGSSHGVGNIAALANVVRTATPGDRPSSAAERRQQLADFCLLIAERSGFAPTNGSRRQAASAEPLSAPALDPKLPRRLRQTLELLLRGASEKQIAAKLHLSQHTVHVYVKSLHRWYDVSSRAELLARFIPQAPATADSPRFK